MDSVLSLDGFQRVHKDAAFGRNVDSVDLRLPLSWHNEALDDNIVVTSAQCRSSLPQSLELFEQLSLRTEGQRKVAVSVFLIALQHVLLLVACLASCVLHVHLHDVG